MKKLLLILTLQVMLFSSFAQTVQTVINVPINQWGGTYQALLYKPTGYDTTTKKYPLLVFAHGRGESDATDSLPMLYNNQTAGGPSYFIEHGQWPSSFTNPKDGQPYQFIVLTPHARGSGWAISASSLDYAIRHMASAYRVDTNRIYITGLSAGGATITEYVSHAPISGVPFNARYKVAAFVPMSQALGDPAQSLANNIVADSVRAWGFGDAVCEISPTPGGCDGHGENTKKLIDKMNIAKAGFGRFKHYQGGHCCWGNFYKPTYRDSINGQPMNIYEWMLQFSRAPIATPTANAGADKTITLPTSSVTLTGSGTAGAGHTISGYTWTRVSGPNTPTITTPSAASTAVTSLIQGVYIFRLAVKNNANVTATDDVKVTVNPAPVTDTTRFVKVRLYGGANPYTTGGWANWNISANASSGPLLFTNGDSSNATVTVNYLPLIADNGVSYPTTMCPTAVGRYTAYFASEDAIFTITGLNSSKKYNLETYNSRDKIGPYTTDVIVGSVTRSIITDTNYHNAAKFTNLTPTSGTITFRLHRHSTWSYINGFVLTELATDPGAKWTAAPPSKAELLNDNASATEWQTYPDPFTDHVTVRTSFNNPQSLITVRMIDLSGRILLTKTFGNIPAGNWNQKIQVPGSVRKTGFYLLQITGPALEKQVTIKLLKNK